MAMTVLCTKRKHATNEDAQRHLAWMLETGEETLDNLMIHWCFVCAALHVGRKDKRDVYRDEFAGKVRVETRVRAARREHRERGMRR